MGRQKRQPAEYEDLSSMARESLRPEPSNPLRLSLMSESKNSGNAKMINIPSTTSTSEAAPSPGLAQSLHNRMAEDVRECDQCLLDFSGMSFNDKLAHITFCVDQMSDGAESDNSDILSPPVANGHEIRNHSNTKIDEETTSNMSVSSTPQAMSMDDSPAVVGNGSWIPTYDPEQVEMLPERREGDEEAGEVTEVYKLAKLSDMKLYEDRLEEVENNGTLADHQTLNCNIHQAMIELQNEYMDLQAAVITHHLPNTISIEDEQAREKARVRGAPNQGLKPTQKYIDPRAKPQRSDDPTKWFYTDDWVRNEDKKEAAVYGYIYKESPSLVGNQDPIGQRPRQAGERDLRVRQPQRNPGGDGDDDSGDESGLNTVNDALLEGGRGKRIKQPSSRAVPLAGSRGNSPQMKQPRKDAKTRLQPLEADPTVSDTMESTGQWAKNVDAAQNGSDEDDDDEGPQKQQITAAMSEEEKKKIKSYNRSIAGKMGWVKRKAMKAEHAMDSIQGSEAGDGDEGEDSASQSRKDLSEKGKRKPKAKVMITLPDGTQVEQPSAASLNMKNRWAKLREAKAKGLKAPKIGRYKKSEREAMALAASSQAANSGDDGSVATPDAADATFSKGKKRNNFTISDEVEDEEGDDDGKKKNAKPNKRRKNGVPLSESRVVDDEDMATMNATIESEDEEVTVDANGENFKRSKRPASQEPEDAPRSQRRDDRPSPGRRRNTQSITSDEEETNESPAKTAKAISRATKTTIKDNNSRSPSKKAFSQHNFANGNVRGGTIIDFGPLAGGPVKKNKGGRPRKSVTKSAEKVVDDPESPVASIEENSYQDENDNQAHGHPPRDVDPKVAQALAKKEAAKKAKSEKMKAITKARWASGEMHEVMEKKKANNLAKKQAAQGGTAFQPIAIAPAPVLMMAPPPLRPMSATPSLPPATKGNASGASKKAPQRLAEVKVKKERGGSQTPRSQTRPVNKRVTGLNGAHSEPPQTAPRKLSQYEVFQQLSSPSASGSPLPRGRRPAALRAKESFADADKDDELEEEEEFEEQTVKKYESEEDEDEESDEEEKPKKLSVYEEYLLIMNSGGLEGGRRKRKSTSRQLDSPLR